MAARQKPDLAGLGSHLAAKSLVFARAIGHKTPPSVFAEPAMPKVKTHSGAKKRFKRTGTGKFKFAHVFKRHLLTNRSKKRKRQARGGAYVPDAHHHQIEKLLPYKE
jgi:large subunit ribosomal protein L35